MTLNVDFLRLAAHHFFTLFWLRFGVYFICRFKTIERIQKRTIERGIKWIIRKIKRQMTCAIRAKCAIAIKVC